MITVPVSWDDCEHCDYLICLAKSLPSWVIVWIPRKLELRQQLPYELVIVQVTPGSWMRDTGATWGRRQHCQGGYCIGLSFLANKNTEHPINFEFQINNQHFVLLLSTYHALFGMFTWDSKFTGPPVFYPATLALQLVTWACGTKKLYKICFRIELFVLIPHWSKFMFPRGRNFSKPFCVAHTGLSGFPLSSAVPGQKPVVRCHQVGPVGGWSEAVAVATYKTVEVLQRVSVQMTKYSDWEHKSWSWRRVLENQLALPLLR